MKFNPITKAIYTNDGKFVKHLSCPLSKKWDSLLSLETDNKRFCKACDHEVMDSSKLNDEELAEMVKHNPNACLKIDINQENLTIITDARFI